MCNYSGNPNFTNWQAWMNHLRESKSSAHGYLPSSPIFSIFSNFPLASSPTSYWHPQLHSNTYLVLI